MDLATPLLTYGPLGIVVIAEALVISRLYGDNKALQKEKDDLQEARRQDMKETNEKVTAPLQSISQTMNLVYDKLKASKEA
jgi:hypothetical protein